MNLNKLFFCLVILFISCNKDSALTAKDYLGAYVGNVTSTEGSDNKKTILNNCTLIITAIDNNGQVNCDFQAVNFPNIKLVGVIEGNNLTLTKYEMKSNEYLYQFYGTASLNSNTISINFKEDEFKNGNPFYQISWIGILAKTKY